MNHDDNDDDDDNDYMSDNRGSVLIRRANYDASDSDLCSHMKYRQACLCTFASKMMPFIRLKKKLNISSEGK